MFSSKNNSKEMKAFIGKDCKFEGKFIFKGSVKIDGIFEGDILGKEGTLIVGETSEITGTIDVEALINKGKIQGNVRAQKIENFSPGKIIGTIEVNSLFVQNGAIIDGECRMLKNENIQENDKIKKLEITGE